MKHNFPDTLVYVDKKLTINELKEIVNLMMDCELELRYVGTAYIKKYPYIFWDGFKVAQTLSQKSFGICVSFTEFKKFLKGQGKCPYIKNLQLNDEYDATITKENVKVGCQQFSHEIIKKLYLESQKALKS